MSMRVSKALPLAIALFACAALVQGAAEATPGASAGKTTSTKQAQVTPVNNKLCPVSGQAVGSMQKGSHIVYKGQSVGLCCDHCKDKFMSDPESYLAKAKK